MLNEAVPALEAYSGAILHFLKDPYDSNLSDSYEYFDDGILLVDLGKMSLWAKPKINCQKLQKTQTFTTMAKTP